jgi:hypothetical protein
MGEIFTNHASDKGLASRKCKGLSQPKKDK